MIKQSRTGIAAALIAAFACGPATLKAETTGPEVRPADLRCESMIDPLGIDASRPRLSWKLEMADAAIGRDIKQTAYQIVVASSAAKLAAGNADLWDSGRVESDQNLYVEYQGEAPGSRQECFWKVRVWTAGGDTWSASAKWSMGLLQRSDWQAKWISASRWFVAPEYRKNGCIVQGAPSWVQVELKGPVRIDAIRLHAHTREDFPLRFRIEASDEMDFNNPQIIADCSAEDFQIGESKVAEFPGNGITASRVRILITGPPSGKSESIIRQMEILSDGKNVALMRTALQSGHRWETGHGFLMLDGMPSANDGATCPEDACPSQEAPLLRKAFNLEQGCRRATLYYAAHGTADITINGRPVDDSLLGPRFSDYAKRIYYRTVDVTGLLGQGGNVIGAVLGNGFFSPPGSGFGQRHGGRGQPRLLLQLEVEMEDGGRRMIAADETWRWARGEIVFNDMWNGYNEDRRLAKTGWTLPGYADESWRTVGLVEPLDGELSAAPGLVARTLGMLAPERVEGNVAYFSTLSAGWPRLEVKNGKAGQTISLQGDYGVPCSFTLAADGPTVLEPRLVWGSGPLKLTVTGLTEPLAAENIRIRQVGTDFTSTGSFTCSNPWFNTLHEVVLRTHRNYNLDYPVDPMREKQGWTQDAESFFNTAAYLTEVPGYYRAWWQDMADNQRPNGLLGSIMPLMGQCGSDWNCPWWSGMIAWLPWEHYLYYGDTRFLENAYEPMRRYVDYLDRIASLGAGTRALDFPDPHYHLNADAARDRLLIWSGANDWQHPDGSINWYASTETGPLVNMAAWYHYANVVSQTAAMLGNTADSAKYAAMARDIADRTNRKFLNSATGRYGQNTKDQTAQVLSLAVGMVPPETRELTRQRLLDAIRERNGHHATGFVALPYLLRILAETGEGGMANRIVNQQDYPSWKTLVHHGVLAEGWEGGGAQMPSCGGSVGMWLYQSVLGIRPDPAGPGFKKFILAPQPDPATGLTSAEGSYDTPYGRIASKWNVVDQDIILNVTVPPNTTASVHVPARNEACVTESGQAAGQAKGVKFLRMEHGAAVFEVASGNYAFRSRFLNKANVIYAKDFSGVASPHLNTKAPDIRIGSETWSASTLWKSDGTVGDAGNGSANAFLPFTPVAGKIYTLTATVDVTTTDDDWLALGFTSGKGTGAWFSGPEINAAAWMLERGGQGASGYQTIGFMGPSTGGGSASVPSSNGPVDLRVELNTQNPLWSVRFYRNGVQMGGTMSYTTNPAISHVAMAGQGAAGSFTNFNLSSAP